MPNASFIQLPPNVDNPIVLKRFLSTLVEQLDVIFGFRGNAQYISATDANEALIDAQSTLGLAIQAAEDAAKAEAKKLADQALDDAKDYADANFTNNPEQAAIADLAYTAPTVSASYVQAEVQGIADDLETTSDKLDVILAALRSADIIAP